MLSLLLQLPTALIDSLQIYLSSFEYGKLLSTNKQANAVRLETQVIVVSRESILRLLKNETKEEILGKVQSPHRQLLINIKSKTILLKFRQKYPDWTINDLTVSGVALSFFTQLPRAKRFILSENDSITTLLDVFNDSITQKVTMNRFHTLANVTALRKIRCIELNNCDSLKDVTALDAVYDLTLRSCNQLTLLKGLNNNTRVKVIFCERITDYSNCFRNSRDITIICQNQKPTLNLSYFSSIIKLNISRFLRVEGMDVPPPSLKYVSFSSMTGLSIIERLSYLQEVSLLNIVDIISVAPLGSVYRVTFSNLQGLESLEGLGRGNKIVKIENCPIRDFSPINGVPTVHISQCTHFLRADQLSNVSDLAIDDDKITDVSTLGRCQRLFLRCAQISSLEGLGEVKEIHLDDCMSLTSLCGVKNNVKIVLEGSDFIRSLDSSVEKLLDRYSIEEDHKSWGIKILLLKQGQYT